MLRVNRTKRTKKQSVKPVSRSQHGAAGADDLPDNYFVPLYSAFAKSVSLIEHQVDSYNQLMKNDIREIIQSQNPIEVVEDNEIYSFSMKNVRVDKPLSESMNNPGGPLLPQECRVMKNSYTTNVYYDMHFTLKRMAPNGNQQIIVEKVLKNQIFAQVPVMLRSKMCWTHNMSYEDLKRNGEDAFEMGGYFIIEGGEKAIIPQDEKATNCFYLNRRVQKRIIDASIKSRSRSMLYSDISSHLYVVLEETSRKFYVTLNLWSSKKNQIPIVTMFQALGAVTDKEIVQYMIGDISESELYNIIDPSLRDDKNEATVNRDIAARIMIHRMIAGADGKNFTDIEHARRMKEKIDTQFLPHLGTSMEKKRFVLGYMCRKVLLAAIGKLEPDDIFNYGNKRIHTPGILIGMHISQNMSHMKKNIQTNVTSYKKLQNNANIRDIPIETVLKFFNNAQSQRKIVNTMATGKWNIGSAHYNTASNKISMQMERKSRFDVISIQRRISTGTRDNNTNLKVHQLHISQKFFICPAETPESERIGLVKHQALTTHITINNETETSNLKVELDKLFEEGLCMKLFDLPLSEIYSHTNIFTNGNIEYCTDKPLELCDRLRERRRQGTLRYTSVIYDYRKNEIRLFTDHGRIMRPLYIVDPDNKLRMTRGMMEKLDKGELSWNDLLDMEIIEYVCIHELEHDCLIALWPSWIRAAAASTDFKVDFTHCELHPTAMFGISALLIPFPNFEHSPRITFQSVMVKQSMDPYALNMFLRFDTVVNWLISPQRPLTTTFSAQLINADMFPNGVNAITLVACYDGYNQDDSLFKNSSPYDRGLFNSYHFKTYLQELQPSKNYATIKPDPTRTSNYKTKSSYDVIGPDGLPIVGKIIRYNDVILGRVQILSDTQGSEIKYKDKCVLYKDQVPGVISKVTVAPNINNDKYVRIVVRMWMKPVIGDKFSARHGQKGTSGLSLPQHNFPYIAGGIVPDIVLNPHAIPSRMTIGMMIEMLYQLLAIGTGNIFDCSAYGDYDSDWVSDQLEKLGYDRHCNVTAYHPITGGKIDTKMFMSLAYYQRLKHLVFLKMQVRARGPKTVSMRQPVQGKKENGGSRFGEMERDAVLAHGAAAIINVKFLSESDKFHVYVCGSCGFMAVGNKKTNIYRCDYCSEKTPIYRVNMPYATKRFLQEIISYGISPRLILA